MSSQEQCEAIEYQVKKILSKRIINDINEIPRIQYLVHWNGYARHEATWQPTENLLHASQKVRKYQKSLTTQNRQLKNETKNKKKQKPPHSDLNNNNSITYSGGNNNFTIVGTKRVFFVQYQNGQKQEVGYEKIVKNFPNKLIEFYQKNIDWNRKNKNVKNNKK